MNLQTVFSRWEFENKGYLQSCSDKEIAVTFSGGRDSSVCLSFLNRVREKYGYKLKVYLYAFPVHRYVESFRSVVNDFWRKKGITVDYNVPAEDDKILEVSETPCRVCQDIRKKQLLTIFNQYRNRIRSLVIVSGHSLWDLAGYAINRLVASELAVESGLKEAASVARFIEVSQRFYPYFTMLEGYSIYRPMLFLNQNEIDTVIEEEALPILNMPCKYSFSRPKKILEEYFTRFGYRFTYSTIIEFAKKKLNIFDIKKIQNQSHIEFLPRIF